MKIILNNLMTMEYVRVRKSTLKDIQAMLKKQEKPNFHLVAAIFGMVVAVAVTGLLLIM